MIYNDLCLVVDEYLKESAAAHNKRIDLIIVDIEPLYRFRPSRYNFNGKNILESVELPYQQCNMSLSDFKDIDLLDSVILANCINFIIRDKLTVNCIHNFIDELLYNIFENYKIYNSFNIYNYDQQLIYDYILGIRNEVNKLIKRYTTGFIDANSYSGLDEIVGSDKVFMVHSIETSFTDRTTSMYMVLKLYTNNKAAHGISN